MTNISPASKPPPPGLRDETRMGNTVLTVFGYFKRDTSDNKKAKTWSPRSAGGTSSTRPDLMLMALKQICIIPPMKNTTVALNHGKKTVRTSMQSWAV